MGGQNPYTKGRRVHNAWNNGYSHGMSGEVVKVPYRGAEARMAFLEGWTAGNKGAEVALKAGAALKKLEALS
jgi:ribosome modulation factor